MTLRGLCRGDIIKGAVWRYGRRARSTNSKPDQSSSTDPRLALLGHAIEDEYATIRSNYRQCYDSDHRIANSFLETPKHPIVLAHGLLGFDELHLAGSRLPGVHYWRGITEALSTNGIEVITASVPPSASIEERAARLGRHIAKKAAGKNVNIVA